jgi:hypothetical protein
LRSVSMLTNVPMVSGRDERIRLDAGTRPFAIADQR